MSAFISKITTKVDSDAARKALLIGSGSGWCSHEEIWKLFPADLKERPFLFREFDGDPQAGAKSFLLVSTRSPKNDGDVFDVETKPFEPRVEKGARLAFKLKANATMSTRDKDKKQSRHDVVMHAIRSMPGPRADARRQAIDIAGLEWIRSQGARNGFEVPEAPAIEYRPGAKEKPNHSRTREITLSALDYDGTLIVTDAATFAASLVSGIGRAKAFGYGLLLVRPLV